MINWARVSVWYKNFSRRRKLSLTSSRDNRVVWYTHISPLNLTMALLAAIVLIFTVVLLVVSYTPIIETLPGYRDEKLAMRESVVDAIVRIDSMERVITNMKIYSDNVSLIMSGRTPEVEAMLLPDSIVGSKSIVSPNSADSTLRAAMQGDGRYNLQNSSLGGVETLVLPIDGEVVRNFNISEESYGVEILASDSDRVLASLSGVVSMVNWTAESDYVVQIIHSNSMITLYKGMKNITVKRGESVEAGAVIGYNYESKSVGFEIWRGGVPVNPESYIIF